MKTSGIKQLIEFFVKTYDVEKEMKNLEDEIEKYGGCLFYYPKINLNPKEEQYEREYLGWWPDSESNEKVEKCSLPPKGWRCTREPGHEGPCAAWLE